MRRRYEFSAVHWVVLTVVPFTAVAFSAATVDPTSLIKWWLAVVAAGIGVSIYALSIYRSESFRVPPVPFLVAVLVFLLALMSSVLMADEQMRAVVGAYGRWNGAGAYVAYAALGMLAAVGVTDERRREQAATAVLIAAACVGVYALVQRAGVDPVPWTTLYGSSAQSFLGNPNFASAYLGIPFPLLISRMFSATSRRKGGVGWYAAAGLLALAAIWSTGSWIGFVAAMVGSAVLGLVVLATSPEPARRRLAAIAAIAASAVAALMLHGFWSGWLPAPYAASIRLYYWRAAVAMFADRPFTGVGIGRFEHFFRRFRPADQFDEFSPSILVDNPHSVPLTLAAEGGLLVVIPWLLVIGCAAWLVLLWIRSASRDASLDLRTRLSTAAWIGVLGAYAVQTLVSFDVPPVAVLGWVVLGVVTAGIASPTQRRIPKVLARAVPTLAIIAAVVVVRLAWAPVSADSSALTAVRLLESGQPEAAVIAFDRAADRAWWEPRYRLFAARTVYQGGNLEGALERFEAMAAMFPMTLDPVLASARVATELGYEDRAAEWYGRVLILEPYDPALVAEAGALIDATESTP